MGYGDCHKKHGHGKSHYGDCKCKSHSKCDCKSKHGFKHDCDPCGKFKKVKCGCTDIWFKKGTAKVVCRKKLPWVAGFFLICREKTLANNYNTDTVCGLVEPVSELCLVVQVTQNEDHPKFCTIQVLNVTNFCPILCKLVKVDGKDHCPKWKMVGAGGNAARNYVFKLKNIKCWEVNKFSYHFTQGRSSVNNSSSTSQAAVGCGNAHRICEDEVQTLIDRFSEGVCDPPVPT